MSRRNGLLLIGALLIALGLLGSYLLGRAEPYEEVIKHGPSPEARSNRYLAAEHFLRKQGIAVERADSLARLKTLPSRGQTLLLLGSRYNMTPQQTDRLLAWTAQGGHLVVVAERLWDKEQGKSGDLLLDTLSIEQYESADLPETEPEQADSPAAAQHPADTEKNHYPTLTQLYLQNETAPAYIGFDTEFHLADPKNQAYAWANSADSTHLLQLYYGEGLVTVMTDAWIWQNDKIDRYDNAWLLWYLTQDSRVTMLYRAEHDSLATLLWRNYRLAIGALLLLIISAVWHLGMRQGPIRQPASHSRRQLLEHLRASAEFIVRHNGQKALMRGLQIDIQRRARRRHPGFDKLDVAQQWHIIGRLSRMPASAISRAMRPLPNERLSASEFTRQVAHLQTLRNAL